MTEETTTASARVGPWSTLPDGEACRHDDVAACTKVPPERIGEFLDWPSAKLHREARQVSRILVRFAKVVLDSMDSSNAVDDFVRSLDLASISRDHDWRVVFSAIRDERRTDEDFRHWALVKYLQYLSFRKRLLEFIYARRQGLEETGAYSGLQWHGTTTPRLAQGGASAGEGARVYSRLPLGEAVDLDLGGRRSHKLVLAGYVLYLQGAFPPTLKDKHGAEFRLRLGRNVVGRHPESDIALDPSHSGISRAHAVLVWDGTERVSVTDLSSAGTLLRVDETGNRTADRALG